MVSPPAFPSSCLLSFIFPLQECGSDWCRWRPDCATCCPASRWRLAKRRLCVLFLKKNLFYCACMGRFDCPSTECSSEITHTHTYIYTHTYTHTHTHIYIYTYIRIHAQYIPNTNTNIYLKTSLEEALFQTPVFSRQVWSCSVHYKFNTSGHLTLPNDFLNKTSKLIHKSHFEWLI